MSPCAECEPGYSPVAAGSATSANAHTLFDVSGNIIEWTVDRVAPSPGTDPLDFGTPSRSTNRVIRGGGRSSRQYDIEASDSNMADPDNTNTLGLRLVRTMP